MCGRIRAAWILFFRRCLKRKKALARAHTRAAYALEKLPHTDPQSEQPADNNGSNGGNSFFGRLRKAARGIIEGFLRLIRRLGCRKKCIAIEKKLAFAGCFAGAVTKALQKGL